MKNNIANIPTDWISVKDAVSVYPIGRTMLFGLIQRNSIKSALLRSPGSLKGRRIVYRPSVDSFLHSLTETAS